MREIKFRAWEKSMKEMINVDSIDFERKIINKEFVWRMLSEVVLTQFTELKDKNGIEIYEGDVVKGYYDEYDTYFKENIRHYFISDVKKIDNSFKVRRDTVNEEGRIRDFGYQHEWDSKTVEVIGNIFENPELLEEN